MKLYSLDSQPNKTKLGKIRIETSIKWGNWA